MLTRRWFVFALAAIGALAACRSGDGASGDPQITVIATAGSGMDGAGGMTVLSHRADGSIIDDQNTDATGTVQLGVEPGALISVFFTPSPDGSDGDSDGDPPPPISIVTTAVPTSGTLVVHGPAVPGVPLVAGGLNVAPQVPLAADVFDIDLGCSIVEVTSLPTSVDVAGACLGTDQYIDALVRGYTGTGSARQLVGYVAGRVVLDDPDGMIAQLTPPTWTTTVTRVPITIDAGFAAGATPSLAWTLWVDSLPFDADAPLVTTGSLWTGLMVDRVTVTAVIGAAGGTSAQAMTRFVVGVPTAVEVGPSDVMDPVASAIVVDARAPLAIAWTAAGPTGADLVDARIAWSATSPTIWDVVLPPGAATIVFPALDDTLSSLVELPGPDAQTVPIATDLRYLDSTDFTDFDDAQAAGVFATATTAPSPIVPDPTTGEVRVSDATATQ